MARTADSLGTPGGMWPPAGWTHAICTRTEKWKSPKKGTGAVKLYMMSTDGMYEFEDAAFVTTKTLKRLNLIAQRFSGMPKEIEIPDDDVAACKFLGNYIFENCIGKSCDVFVEEYDDTVFHEEGPKAGQKETIKRKRVTYGGYRKHVEVDPVPQMEQSADQPEEDIPF